MKHYKISQKLTKFCSDNGKLQMSGESKWTVIEEHKHKHKAYLDLNKEAIVGGL